MRARSTVLFLIGTARRLITSPGHLKRIKNLAEPGGMSGH
jgi:hypothetical protein